MTVVDGFVVQPAMDSDLDDSYFSVIRPSVPRCNPPTTSPRLMVSVPDFLHDADPAGQPVVKESIEK